MKKNIILDKYSNYFKFFLAYFIIKKSRYICINNYTIDSKKSKQLYHKSIHNLKMIKLKIFNIYIKINLITKLI